MNLELTHPGWLLVLLPMLAWVIWLSWTSHATGPVWRRWAGLAVRLSIVLALGLALAGLRWRQVQEGMNVYFLLDRSDSIPANQQDFAREYVGRVSNAKQPEDNVGILVFGSEASIESSPLSVVRSDTKIYAVVGGDRTDIASAIRLGTAAFPESGQKRLVLVSDGQENVGDAVSAAVAARSLGVSLEVLPLGAVREGDVAVQRVSMPANVKLGQPFEVKIFVEADGAREGAVRLYVNEALRGEQTILLENGKNLLTLPQTLGQPGFHQYEVRVEAAGDGVPRNNRASAFTNVRGDPRVLVVSAQPDGDELLGRALSSTNLTVVAADIGGFPGTLAEMQSYDAIVLSNVAAGDLGDNLMRLLESAVRDFGVGLICIGGDQAFAAGGYRGTPLDRTLPVDMELSSKKVMPPGAVVLVMHGMEFNNGNQVARDCAIGVLEALGPQDQMGVVLWDGRERWLFPIQRVGDRKELRRAIAAMNQGDLPSFQNVLTMAHTGLKETRASLKHIIVFSDGDPGPPTPELMRAIVDDRITVSSVLIAGHAGPEIMVALAEQGRGRFYHVTSPAQLPQVFIKEAAVILKSAISEEPFLPQAVVGTEVTRGIGADEYPMLQGYVATGLKARAETPLMTDKGDPLLAHWQYGLGRSVAFTSDARARWAVDWLGWPKYRQFWAQVVAWALRRIDSTEWIAEVGIVEGEGLLSVDALSATGDYLDFLDLQAVIVDPLGNRQLVRLDQTGPGHYEVRFPTREPGSYMVNLAEIREGRAVSLQVLGATMNYSPEFSVSGTNLHLLRALAEAGGGRMLNESSDPFGWERLRTHQARDLWRFLLIAVVLLMPMDVGIRRVQLDPEEWGLIWSRLMRWLHLRRQTVSGPAGVSLSALLASRDKARSGTTTAGGVTAVQRSPARSGVLPVATKTAPAPKPTEPGGSAPVSTTARLLEAKRRARAGGKSGDREQ
jgi:uncharacterized membrane protein/Mg-chelatase subunit ChlD